MATFNRIVTIEPVSISNLRVELFDSGPAKEGMEVIRSARFGLDIVMNDGSTKVLSGNLLPHLTQEEITALINFMETLRNRATTQIIGE